MRYSYKFPTLLTIIVDGNASSPGGNSPVSGRDPQEWRLPSADPREPGKYMYRLHTLDVYFWTLDDAKSFIDIAKKHLAPYQLDILDAPETSPRQVSSVVQQLENVAISDPAYRNGQTRDSQNQPQPASLPGPAAPLSFSAGDTSAAVQKAAPAPPQSPEKKPTPESFQPLAYNPAAPPAPEPIAHREDTPPPPDAGTGTGLAEAAAADHAPHLGVPGQAPYTGVPPPPAAGAPPNPWGAPPPPSALQNPSPYNPSPQPQMQHHGSVSSAHTSRHPSVASNYMPAATSPPAPNTTFGPPPTLSQTLSNPSPRTSFSSPPIASPGSQLYNAATQPGAAHAPVQHLQPQYPDYLSQARPPPPPGGYANYSYDQRASSVSGNPYDVHSQVYRPTEVEATSHHKHHRHSDAGGQGQGQKPTGRFEDRMDRAEKGVNRFLKKLEKRL
ncbi:MAG: hypothetical protein Q9227_000675 [Pyrenula ochraceoflavens]